MWGVVGVFEDRRATHLGFCTLEHALISILLDSLVDLHCSHHLSATLMPWAIEYNIEMRERKQRERKKGMTARKVSRLCLWPLFQSIFWV